MSVGLIMAAGAVATMVAWRLVQTRGVSIWPTMTVAVGTFAALSLATGRVELSSNVQPLLAALVGIGAGLGLYGATIAFVVVARHWPAFERAVEEIYDQRGGLSAGTALGLAAFVVAPCEDVFWRGLFQGQVSRVLSPTAGAVLSVLAYTAASGASASLAVIVAALVSGSIWSALAWWTHGVLASICCHSLWTALMIAMPPPRLSRVARRAAPAAE